MAEVKFTEKELGFINECTIDKQGNLTNMPANPFPSLYRKGVIEKRKDRFVVAKEFRDMFYLEGQVIDLTVPEAKPEAGADPEHVTVPAKAGWFAWPDELPADLAEFRVYLGNILTFGSTKCIDDEFTFIDCIEDVLEFTCKVVAENGEEASTECGTAIGKRKSWRIRLGELCAQYFGVGHQVVDRDTYFDGEGYMASACEFSYKYLFKLGNRIAQRHYDDLLEAGGETRGSYNRKADEFLEEVAKRFQKWTDEWAEAHTITDPETGEAIGEITGEYDD